MVVGGSGDPLPVGGVAYEASEPEAPEPEAPDPEAPEPEAPGPSEPELGRLISEVASSLGVVPGASALGVPEPSEPVEFWSGRSGSDALEPPYGVDICVHLSGVAPLGSLVGIAVGVIAAPTVLAEGPGTPHRARSLQCCSQLSEKRSSPAAYTHPSGRRRLRFHRHLHSGGHRIRPGPDADPRLTRT